MNIIDRLTECMHRWVHDDVGQRLDIASLTIDFTVIPRP